MKLRDYPLLSCRGVSSWPPTWVGWNSKQLDQSKAETAILKDVTLSTTALRCYLMIEHEGDEYLGALLFEDHNSCLRIYRLLLSHRGEVIRKVSEIDVPHSITTAPILSQRRAKHAAQRPWHYRGLRLLRFCPLWVSLRIPLGR